VSLGFPFPSLPYLSNWTTSHLAYPYLFHTIAIPYEVHPEVFSYGLQLEDQPVLGKMQRISRDSVELKGLQEGKLGSRLLEQVSLWEALQATREGC
jgi:hypothetical protein